jgi:hypothetical protein
LLHFSKGLNSNIRVNGQPTPVISVLGSITGIGGISPRLVTASADTTKESEIVSAVSQGQADTSDTTLASGVVSAESPINKGSIPPKNRNPCSAPDSADLSAGPINKKSLGGNLLPLLDAKGAKLSIDAGKLIWSMPGAPTDEMRKWFKDMELQIIAELQAREAEKNEDSNPCYHPS